MSKLPWKVERRYVLRPIIPGGLCQPYVGLSSYESVGRGQSRLSGGQEARDRRLDLRSFRHLVAFLEHDSARMQEQVSWAMAKPETKQWALQQPGDNAIYHGRFRAARGFYSAMRGYPPSSGPEVGNWHVVAYTALADVETGHAAQARQAAERAWAEGPPSSFRRTLALVLARSWSRRSGGEVG